MAVAPTPEGIFDRAVEEDERRLDQSLLELVSTSFIAGFIIVFGIVALGIVEAVVEPRFGEVAKVAGALAFALGLVFSVDGALPTGAPAALVSYAEETAHRGPATWFTGGSRPGRW